MSEDTFRIVVTAAVLIASLAFVVQAGIVLAIGAARIIASTVQGMPTFDVVAFVGASVCVFIVCLCAAFVPSRRVANTDPTSALRHD